MGERLPAARPHVPTIPRRAPCARHAGPAWRGARDGGAGATRGQPAPPVRPAMVDRSTILSVQSPSTRTALTFVPCEPNNAERRLHTSAWRLRWPGCRRSRPR